MIVFTSSSGKSAGISESRLSAVISVAIQKGIKNKRPLFLVGDRLDHVLQNCQEVPPMILSGRVNDHGSIATSTLDLPHTETQSMQPSPGLGRAQTDVQPLTSNYTHRRASSSFSSKSQRI